MAMAKYLTILPCYGFNNIAMFMTSLWLRSIVRSFTFSIQLKLLRTFARYVLQNIIFYAMSVNVDNLIIQFS